MIALDKTDRNILVQLQSDGRMTNAQLAERVHLSESACLRRVRRLESEGVIKGYATLVDQGAIGRPTNVFVEISLVSQSVEIQQGFEDAVRDCPDIMSCHLMSGDSDYLIHLVVADTPDFERVHRSYLSRLPGVARIRSSFALRTVCHKTAFDL